MLFENVTRTINNSKDQRRKLTQAILNVQSFFKKSNKKVLSFEGEISENKKNPGEHGKL